MTRSTRAKLKLVSQLLAKDKSLARQMTVKSKVLKLKNKTSHSYAGRYGKAVSGTKLGKRLAKELTQELNS